MTTLEVELTDVGKRWLQDHHPQGIVWEYDVARARASIKGKKQLYQCTECGRTFCPVEV